MCVMGCVFATSYIWIPLCVADFDDMKPNTLLLTLCLISVVRVFIDIIFAKVITRLCCCSPVPARETMRA